MPDDVYSDEVAAAAKNEEPDVEGHADEVESDEVARSEDEEPDVEAHSDEVMTDEVMSDDVL